MKVRFPSIYILLNCTYYFLELTIITVLAIKTVGFPKAKQTLNDIFAMDHGNIKV